MKISGYFHNMRVLKNQTIITTIILTTQMVHSVDVAPYSLKILYALPNVAKKYMAATVITILPNNFDCKKSNMFIIFTQVISNLDISFFPLYHSVLLGDIIMLKITYYSSYHVFVTCNDATLS